MAVTRHASPGAPSTRRAVLPRAFFARPTLEVLPDLMGKVLVHERRGQRTAGVIVEAEAYIGEDDPACHAAPGRTARNAPLYGPPGHAYVYLNYGIHYLVNAVTEEEGTPAAILIRALEPVDGLRAMRLRRARHRAPTAAPIADVDLCRGPGNLTVALGIDLALNRVDLVTDQLWIEDAGIRRDTLCYSARIGIRVGADRAWRCYDGTSACVSGPSSFRGRA